MQRVLFGFMCLISSALLFGPGVAEACTSIVVGKAASADGSVMTSHTLDSHRNSSAVMIVPPKKHKENELQLDRRQDDDSGPMERYSRIPTGPIPQVAETYGYLASDYSPMNDKQVAIGESTFGGREELVSEKGLIDCQWLQRLMLERAVTARGAIRLAGELLEKYGWNDEGEALTIVDKDEAWVIEIVGPGKDEVGAIWAAQRVPDDHVSVEANGARIRKLDLDNPEYFMASSNVVSAAVEKGYYDPKSGEPFEFCYAYNPEGRYSAAVTRREWRVLDLLAPSLKLNPEAESFPFSVKPEKPVTPERIMEIYRDTYEGTDYDMVKGLTVTDEETGKTVKSPLANPWMPYDANKLFKINGGWGWRGERTIARWYTMYAIVTQSRSWLPDPVGGLVWFGYGNTAMTTYVPVFIGVTDLPQTYKTDGRTTGFSREAAWWAFNRVETLSAHRWGDMQKDVAAVRDPLQQKFFDEQKEVEKAALELLQKKPQKAAQYLTDYVMNACNRVVQAYWDLGDLLWTKYDEKW